MTYSERRNRDVLITNQIAKICDDSIYVNLPYLIKRNYNAKLQKEGVDLFWGKGLVDEKMAITALEYDLPTFAFEISSSNNHGDNGWFLQKKYYKTTSYLIGYPRGSFVDDELNIQSLELLMLNKGVMWKYLNSVGLTSDSLELMAEQIKRGETTPTETKNKSTDHYELEINGSKLYGLKLTHSRQLGKETPVNIIIYKHILKKLATEIYMYENNILSITKKYQKLINK